MQLSAVMWEDSSTIVARQTSMHKMFYGTMMTRGCHTLCFSLLKISLHYRS
uniref:SDG920 n=1 Tax=Arundo donax TaxID=35708 RepID=A0A0A9CQM5_ARUDO